MILTASGKSWTAATFNTAKAVALPGAAVLDATAFIPVVREKIRFSLSAARASNSSIRHWQRYNDAAIQTGCKFVTAAKPGNNAYSEYTPIAVTAIDVGKYRQAYIYYIGNA